MDFLGANSKKKKSGEKIATLEPTSYIFTVVKAHIQI